MIDPIKVLTAELATLTALRTLLDPHRRMGESDEEVLGRISAHARKDLILDVCRDQGIEALTVFSWNGKAHTVVLTKNGEEMRFERVAAAPSAGTLTFPSGKAGTPDPLHHSFQSGEWHRRNGKPRDWSAIGFVAGGHPADSNRWYAGWDAEDERLEGVSPPRIGDILVDAAGNREMVTTEGDRVNSRITPNPDGTVTLAPGVRIERRATEKPCPP